MSARNSAILLVDAPDARGQVAEVAGFLYRNGANILEAEGHKESQIRKAEGEKDAAILRAEGLASARLAMADAEAEAVRRITAALPPGEAATYLLGLKYLEALPQLAQGKASTIFLPSEATGVLGALGQSGCPSSIGGR